MDVQRRPEALKSPWQEEVYYNNHDDHSMISRQQFRSGDDDDDGRWWWWLKWFLGTGETGDRSWIMFNWIRGVRQAVSQGHYNVYRAQVSPPLLCAIKSQAIGRGVEGKLQVDSTRRYYIIRWLPNIIFVYTTNSTRVVMAESWRLERSDINHFVSILDGGLILSPPSSFLWRSLFRCVDGGGRLKYNLI